MDNLKQHMFKKLTCIILNFLIFIPFCFAANEIPSSTPPQMRLASQEPVVVNIPENIRTSNNKHSVTSKVLRISADVILLLSPGTQALINLEIIPKNTAPYVTTLMPLSILLLRTLADRVDAW